MNYVNLFFLEEKDSNIITDKEIWEYIVEKFKQDEKYWKKQKAVKWVLKYNLYKK